jgi:2'-5' RNA ligase superfamily
MTNPGPRSGLIVEIPEAEPAVARHRERLDANARLGIPAHITVLFPFMPPGVIGPAALAELEHLFAAVSRFRFQLDRTDWFGDEVLWLAPRDPGPFRALTRRVVAAFPAFPPYQGQFGDSVPHLTVGHGHPVTDLRAAEESVRAHLPIDAQATTVALVTQQSAGGQWTKAAAFPLA